MTALSYSINRVLSIEHFSTILSLISIFRVTWQFFFCSRWASPPQFNLVVHWVEPITILKAPNATGQPTRSEEQKSSPLESTHPIQIAGLRTRRNASGAPTNDSGTPKPTLAVSRASTPVPAQAPALTPAPASASVSGQPRRYTDEDL